MPVADPTEAKLTEANRARRAALSQFHSADDLPVIYLSGPMSGIADDNFPAFREAARRLRLLGFPVLDPSDFGHGKVPRQLDDDDAWGFCVGRDLGVLPHAEVIVLLPGWSTSRGARLERQVADALGLYLVPWARIADWLLDLFFTREQLDAIDDRDELAQAVMGAGSVTVMRLAPAPDADEDAEDAEEDD
jgi:hypothetical protein